MSMDSITAGMVRGLGIATIIFGIIGLLGSIATLTLSSVVGTVLAGLDLGSALAGIPTLAGGWSVKSVLGIVTGIMVLVAGILAIGVVEDPGKLDTAFTVAVMAAILSGLTLSIGKLALLVFLAVKEQDLKKELETPQPYPSTPDGHPQQPYDDQQAYWQAANGQQDRRGCGEQPQEGPPHDRQPHDGR